MIVFATSVYRKLIIAGFYFAPLALLLLRLGWGWEAFDSGRAHLSHANFPDFVDLLKGFDVPMPKVAAVLAGSTEMVGGVLIMLGFATRLISIPFAFNFAVAIATASKKNVLALIHTDAPHLTANYSKIVDDTAYPFLIMALILISFGPGLFSIDGLLKKSAEKFPSFWSKVRAVSIRWEATVIGFVIGVVAGYPISFYFQPASVKAPLTLSDYICEVYDLFGDHSVRSRALLVWGISIAALVFVGVLVDTFLLKRKPRATPAMS